MSKVSIETISPVVVHQEEFGDIVYLIKGDKRVKLKDEIEKRVIESLKNILNERNLNESIFKKYVVLHYQRYLNDCDDLYFIDNHTDKKHGIFYLGNVSLMNVKTYLDNKIVPYIPGSTIKGMIRSALGDVLRACEGSKITQRDKKLDIIMRAIQVSDFYPIKNYQERSGAIYTFLPFGVGSLIYSHGGKVPPKNKRGLTLINLHPSFKRVIKDIKIPPISRYIVETINKGIVLEGRIDLNENSEGYVVLKKELNIKSEEDLLQVIKEYYLKRYYINERYYELVGDKYPLDILNVAKDDILVRIGYGKPNYYNVCYKIIKNIENRMKNNGADNYYHPNEKFVYSFREGKLYPLGWAKIKVV